MGIHVRLGGDEWGIIFTWDSFGPCTPVSVIRYPVSVLRPECEKFQMAITQQRVIRSTSCLVLPFYGFF